MFLMLINLLLSVIIMFFIGYQIRNRIFPFRSWSIRPQGMEWVNLLFDVYNIYAITSTWIALGVLSMYGMLYMAVMMIALFSGLEYTALRDFQRQAKAYGFKSAVSQWRRFHSKK